MVGAVPSGVSGDWYVGMVENVDEPRTRRVGLRASRTGRDFVSDGGVTCRTGGRARRSPRSGVMME